MAVVNTNAGASVACRSGKERRTQLRHGAVIHWTENQLCGDNASGLAISNERPKLTGWVLRFAMQ